MNTLGSDWLPTPMERVASGDVDWHGTCELAITQNNTYYTWLVQRLTTR
ncbi:hypothetical protein OH492_09315 [Vibrio chagasii]|nr:hypothetical protein [Vibrio chagasii]